MILETVYELEDGGRVRVVDAMLPGSDVPRVVRLVVGEAGRVAMRSQMRIRFDYGQVVPWIHRASGTVVAVAGPDAVALYADVPLRGEELSTVAEFWVGPGERVGFELAYFPSYEPQPGPSDVVTALRHADVFWREWARTCRYDGPWRNVVVRSLLTLKALTDARTGAVLAAPTTSLPERSAACATGTTATAGCATRRSCSSRCSTPVMRKRRSRGARGCCARPPATPTSCRSCTVCAASGGCRSSKRRGCAATPTRARCGSATPRPEQLQLDVYGEVADVIYQAHRAGLAARRRRVVARERGRRGGREALVASPTAACGRCAARRGTSCTRRCWRGSRSTARSRRSSGSAWTARSTAGARCERRSTPRSCALGYDPKRETFTQSYGSEEIDAATLLIPLVGFLPPDDPRVEARCARSSASCSSTVSCKRYTQPSVDDRRLAARRRRVLRLRVLARRQLRACRTGARTRERCSSG